MYFTLSGSGQGVSLLGTLIKLGKVVILPMVIGQLCRLTPLLEVAEKLRSFSKPFSSWLLLAIVFNTFSDTFLIGFGISGTLLAQLFAALLVSYLSLVALFWNLSGQLFPGLGLRRRCAGLFCATQKTLAFGIPFIKTALGHRPDLSVILAPLLLYAPIQLVFGSSLLVPRLREMIEKEEEVEDGGGI